MQSVTGAAGERAWEEMLAEFRALGGAADNICLRDGPLGRGVFPIDPSRPVAIRIPETLLMDAGAAGFVQGRFRVGPNAKLGVREAIFLQEYENRFSWGGGGQEEVQRILDEAQKLPHELRQALRDDHDCGDWFKDATDTLVYDRFLESRCVHYKGRVVLMPIVELLNHSPEGVHYGTESGISLSGKFDGEILGRYSDTDPFGIFANWGFACEQPQAFSVALKNRREDRLVQIGRDLTGLSPLKQYWVPSISNADGAIALKFLMIGNKRFPRLSRGIFYKLLHDAGARDVEETFDIIYRANLSRVASLLALVEKERGAMAETLRTVARFQLQAMSWCIGARAL